MPIAGRPLLEYWFDRLGHAGLHNVRINNHHLPDQLREYIQRVNHRGMFRVSEAYEPVLLGSAGTVHANQDLADDARDCLIIYADNLSDVDLSKLIAFHRSHDDPITMLLFHALVPENCGIAELDGVSRIIGFVEKPEHPKSNLANAGVYALTADTYREIAEMNLFDLGFHVIPKFVGRMRGFLWEGYHRDIGTHEALAGAELAARSVFRMTTGSRR